MINFSHTPVLLDTAVDSLNVKQNGKYIDATLGGAGHTKEIIRRGGLVLGIDQDQDAINHVVSTLSTDLRDGNLLIVKGNFRDIEDIDRENNFNEVDGILFDLGVSSYQLDNGERGFSIKHNERLDMRMDRGQILSAHEVVNRYSMNDLNNIFLLYGEEHNAKAIAQEIIETRKKNPINTTKELARLIEKISHKSEAIHPATRVFQAIRIEVNDEINALKEGLNGAVDVLKPGGRIAVISFHSLEDRVTKQLFERLKRQGIGTVITKKPLTATYGENVKNKRSRSAKLRVFQKN